ENQPDSLSLRILLAQLMARQKRPAEALEELRPMLSRPESGPTLRRLAGELALDAGRNEEARDLLLQALREQPDDQRTVAAVVEAWRRLGADGEANRTLDALLEANPQHVHLW